MAGRKGKKFVPKFEGPIEGYVVNYMKLNFWRIQTVFTMDELMQEARITFLYLKSKYPNIDTPEWFMAVFKTAFKRKIDTWSVRDAKRRKPETCFSDAFDGDSEIESLVVGVDHNYGFLAVMIEEAPEEVLSVLSLMLNCPRELFDLMIDMWRSKGKKKEHGNEFLCEVLGYDSEKVDLVKAVKEYFE